MNGGWSYIVGSYVSVLGAIAAIIVRSAQRGRRLARRVPEERRRWT